MSKQHEKQPDDLEKSLKRVKRENRELRQILEERRRRNGRLVIAGLAVAIVSGVYVNAFGLQNPSEVLHSSVAVPTAQASPTTTSTTTPPPLPTTTEPVVITIPPMTVPGNSPTPAPVNKPAITPPPIAAPVVKVWGFDTCTNPNRDKVAQIEKMQGPFTQAQVKGFVCQ